VTVALAVSWVTPAEVAVALGVEPAGAGDDAWLVSSTAAANEWAYRKRRSAGYVDEPDASPGADVSMGTVLYAESLYRTRGGGDTYASFVDIELVPGVVPHGGMAHVLRMLGVGKPAVDYTPPPPVAEP